MNYFNIVYKVLNQWYINLAALTPRLVVGALVFFLFIATSSYLSKIAVKIFGKLFPKSEKQSTVTTLVGVFRFLIILMGAFISLEIMGFSGFFMKFLGSLGVAGVIAGVALKDLVSSIFSGMLIGIDKAFKIGDYVTIGANSGTVQEIGFLTTKLITDDGKKVYVPNQVIFNSPFFNISDSPQRRVILDFELPADADLRKAKNTILNAVKKVENVDRIETAEVNFTTVKEGNFVLQTKFWVAVGSNFGHTKSNAILAIKSALDEQHIPLQTPASIIIANSSESPSPE